ncbi:hypothetical protein KQI86_18920 [Clostridium sp. MSJ-11]|uniref:DUF3794 domain-containing protein n=1 Tax=Clostridium mobile TaxID=2841512 RepID=A0ABS6EMB7_9CLOT|nr:hypothetical protein [Clostridium mobile]MBU5486376.1 hypothetical protein [Clostridium mobile]
MSLISSYNKCYGEGYGGGSYESSSSEASSCASSCASERHHCEAKVSDAMTKSMCENWPITNSCAKGSTLFKIPTVLAFFTVQIDTEATLTLEDPATDIKFIDKDVKVTQCHLVPGTDKVFLEGFVKKNIVFSTKGCVSKHGVSGDIKHTTLRVPFSCVTKVDFLNGFNAGNIFRENERTIEIETQEPHCCRKDKNVINKEVDHNFIHNSVFNEKVFCEIEEATIFESDIEMDKCHIHHEDHRDKCNDHDDHMEHTFQKIREKMVIFLKVKLLQNRQVCIPGVTFPGIHPHHDKCDK